MKIVAYADLHLFFDKNEKNRYKSELIKIQELLISSNDIDVLVFSGDLMHKVYSMDDENVEDIFQFVKSIVDICKDKQIIFRCIKGTSSHDGKIVEYLNSIYKYKNQMDPRFIFKPCIEKLTIKNKKYSFKWLPESYGIAEEYEELKQTILNEYVDFTFFHGTIDSIARRWNSHTKTNVTTLPKSFIWEEELLLKTSRYFSAGGHIHEPITFPSNRIFYINSYTSHNFSDSNQKKGHMEFIIPDDEFNLDNKFEWKRIINNLAPDYKTIYYDKELDLDDREHLSNFVKSLLVLRNEKTRIKAVFRGKRNHNTNYNVAMIKEMLKNYNNIIKPVFELENSDIILEEEEVNKGLDFSDPNIPLVKKIHMIYEELYGPISEESISKHIKGYTK